MITAIIRNKENTLVLELPHSIYDIYEKLRSIGIMDKATGKPFLVNGKEVTSEVTFTAEKKDGEITVRFTFDGSKVTKQTDIVVFETLYRDGVEIAAHADIEDGGQTVTLTPPAPPVPQTGDNSNLGFWIGLGAVALGGIIAVVIIRVKSRKDEDDE